MKPRIEWLPGRFGVFRFDPGEPLPGWSGEGGFTTVSRSEREVSVLCAWPDAPLPQRRIGPLRAARLEGVLDFTLTGVLAAVSAPLAAEGVSLFSVATFDTDYLLVGVGDEARARVALAAAGFVFTGSASP